MTPENGVAMRKTPEFSDHIAVGDGILGIVVIAQRTDQIDRTVLVFQALAVLEGQVEKDAFVNRQTLGEARFNRRFGDRQRVRVGGEALRVAAEQIAGKLIQYDDRRKGLTARGGQRRNRLCSQLPVEVEKACADLVSVASLLVNQSAGSSSSNQKASTSSTHISVIGRATPDSGNQKKI